MYVFNPFSLTSAKTSRFLSKILWTKKYTNDIITRDPSDQSKPGLGMMIAGGDGLEVMAWRWWLGGDGLGVMAWRWKYSWKPFTSLVRLW